MSIPDLEVTFAGQVNEVVIGATEAGGGTRTAVVKVGGAKTIPFMDTDGETGNPPVVAMEVLDMKPEDWPEDLMGPFEDVADDPGKWAKRCVEEFGAQMVCLKLDSIHPDRGDRPAESAVEATKAVLESVGVPVIIWGSGDDKKDNATMPKVSEACRGERCLLGTATQDNYRVLAAVCQADGHNLIAESPLDINICKQVNNLLMEVEFPLERIVIFPTIGALGYGMEYAYSIQERVRLAALGKDTVMSCPIIGTVGYEAWRAKEARGSDDEVGFWGPRSKRGPAWEAITGVTLLQAGMDILLMRHPKAVEVVKKTIADLTARPA